MGERITCPSSSGAGSAGLAAVGSVQTADVRRAASGELPTLRVALAIAALTADAARLGADLAVALAKDTLDRGSAPADLTPVAVGATATAGASTDADAVECANDVLDLVRARALAFSVDDPRMLSTSTVLPVLAITTPGLMPNT